ncbi:tRNA (guanine-N(7)-)-methyltransferase [Seminavis robusta]|uniref:tRNA (guanine(46)-N(7))-methyltransferase n=1 Tax=Seminavis robusta TaxID=568900 RepID=A0A9N8HWN8_9STRA|nr:tRNA (guanine-N(7)-)-methyltransferase [Seminavis robusta]|eukprot:Sro2229_g319920.1 tRNA (guanine-N(7)-)-methyltransferase (359) ;mRNA; f:2559-3635
MSAPSAVDDYNNITNDGEEGEEEEETTAVDFLQSMMMQDDEQDEDEPASSALSSTPSADPQYNPKKPLWWKKISGRPTKSQKRSIEAMSQFRLPRVDYGSFLDWEEIFASTTPQDNTNNAGREIWLEIGFGTGDNLLASAHQHPDRCFVGAEVHTSGIGKLSQRMHRAILQSQHWTGYTVFTPERSNQPQTPEQPDPEEDEEIDSDTPLPDSTISNNLYSNLRIYGGDGVKLLPYIPTSSLSAVLITFPDPFPKQRQIPYRVVQTQTLLALHRILKHAGRLFVATDHEGHSQWCREKVHQVNTNARQQKQEQQEQQNQLFVSVEDFDRTEWLPVISKYEQKGWNEGRTTHLSCWQVVK